MARKQYDLTILGGGSAGLTAAQIAHSLGAKVLLLDKTRLGGDCLFYGCVPSKSLIYVARVVQQVRRSAELGILTGDVSVDMQKVNSYVQQVIARVGEEEKTYIEGVDVTFGKASFHDAHTLHIDEQKITTRSTLIATGSHPALPAIPDLDEIGYLTNESVFDLMQLPGSLVIAGGGPIGVELGQAFARLGTQVTILQGPQQILAREEPEVAAIMTRILQKEGVTIHTGTRLTGVSRQGSKKMVSAQRGEQQLTFEADEILFALGRRPNVEGMQLAVVGVPYNDRGIEVNEYLRTSNPAIYALGDVIGKYYFTHVATYQAGVATRNALLPIGRKKVDYRNVPWCTFTDPEVGRIGLTVAEAERKHQQVRVISFPWHGIDRAQTENEPEGLIKLVLAGKKEEIVGAHLVGAHAGELLGEIALAMRNHLSINQIYNTIHTYPTYSMGIQQATFAAYLSSKTAATNRGVVKTLLQLL